VEVTGSVPDIRPWIAHADLVVAPMRIARGIQNKVLEAMAMARPVVVSTMGAEGIAAEDGREFLVADGGETFTRAVLHLLRHEDEARAMGQAARQRVVAEYSWDRTLPLLDRWFPGEAASI
jgi:glycosyltransferase involved in cell wall biosynthesis